MNTQKPSPIKVPRKPQYVTVSSEGDFFALFKKVAAEYDNCFMLESLGEDSHISRHSLIGFDPQNTAAPIHTLIIPIGFCSIISPSSPLAIHLF